MARLPGCCRNVVRVGDTQGSGTIDVADGVGARAHRRRVVGNGILADPVCVGRGARAFPTTISRSRRRRGSHVQLLLVSQ